MTKIILSNRSYLIGYNFQEKDVKQLVQIGKRKNFKFINETSVGELQKTLSQTKHCLGIFVFDKGLDKKGLGELDQVLEKQPSCCRWLKIDSGQDLNELVDQFLERLKPVRLNELTAFSANYIMPYIYQGLPEGILVEATQEIEAFDYLVTCECMGDDFIGHSTFKLNSKKLKACFPSYNEIANDMILDRLKEFSNQFLGLVIHNLSRLDIITHISLPISFDISKTARVTSGIYFPSARVADEHGIFQIEFGMINTKGQPLLSLGEITFSPPTDTVELF